MREWENLTWATGQTEEAVMRQAGAAVAAFAERMTGPNQSVLVLAGKGHNGDDAVFAAEALKHTSRVLRVDDPAAALPEIDMLLARKPALIIDGLFGIGLNRPLSEPWVELFGRINSRRVPVLSVDVPSGLNADTGFPMPEAIRARMTVTLGTVKAGLIRPSALPFVGRLEVAPDIGLVPCPFQGDLNLTLAADFTDFPPPRPIEGHKGTFGHVAMIAGSVGFHGAAVLASQGAQRAQPGLITVIMSPEAYVPVASQCQAVMVRPWAQPVQLTENCTALLVGPGLAASNIPQHVKEFVTRAWRESPTPMIVDASALSWITSGTVSTGALRVITPHPGEAAKLLGRTAAEVQADRLGALRMLSKGFGDCLVVLKGHHTLVGRSKNPICINSTGNPLLGQGGSGDLLAGYLAGLLAQPALQADPILTTRYAVWQHGASADALSASQNNWTVEELAQELGRFITCP